MHHRDSVLTNMVTQSVISTYVEKNTYQKAGHVSHMVLVLYIFISSANERTH